jgi:hypothetical protein
MVGSYVNSFPKIAALGLSFNLYFCLIGNITNPYVFDPLAFLDAGLASMVGISVAAFCYSAIAPWGGGFTTQSYLRQLRKLVAKMHAVHRLMTSWCCVLKAMCSTSHCKSRHSRLPTWLPKKRYLIGRSLHLKWVGASFESGSIASYMGWNCPKPGQVTCTPGARL